MTIILFRTLLLYFLIVCSFRLMGKRQIGELQPGELVVTILISNIASIPVENIDMPLLGGILPILALVCFEVFMSALSLKSKNVRTMVSGNSRVVVLDGVIDQQEMRDLRFSMDDLMSELRIQGIFDIREVMLAMVETNGKISIYPRSWARPATPADHAIETQDTHPPLAMIQDGELCTETIQRFGKSESWVLDQLRQKDLSPKDVFLMTVDPDDSVYLVQVDRKKGGGKA